MQNLTYPAIFADCNLDQINHKLAQGYANKQDAESLVNWWNKSGKRFTIATLGERSVTLGGTICLAPYISISND